VTWQQWIDALVHHACPPGVISGAFKAGALRQWQAEHQALMGSLEAFCVGHGTWHRLSDDQVDPKVCWGRIVNETMRDVTS
jgi:hypothetical protein